MKRALLLARRGVGRVSPNPLVGAVVVKQGRIIGEGYYLYEQKDHAEIVALRDAGSRARGASLYVNLEPCVHHGRTGPCVRSIVKAGIKKVFVAVKDPNPLVCGKGIRELQRKGIEVIEGLCRKEADRLNEKFFHFIQQKTPFVLLKLAMSLDGKIATRTGESQWITGEKARRETHRLRYEYDAILVGVETILRDDPSLDVRWTRRNPILKVILDSKARTSPESRVFCSGDSVILFHAAGASARKIKALSRKGEVVSVGEKEGLLDWDEILRELGRRGVSSMIIEGGTRVATSALAQGLVHKVHFFFGPRLIGSSGVPGVVELPVARLSEALQLENVRVKQLGEDFGVEAYVRSK